MCLQDAEQISDGMDKLGLSDHDQNHETWPLDSNFLNTQIENWEKSTTCDQITHLGDSFPVCIYLFLIFQLIFSVNLKPIWSN